MPSGGVHSITPYVFAYDMAAIAIPAAFLARDQIDHRLLRGEAAIACALFAAALALVFIFGDRPGGVTFGGTPFGPIATIALFGLILRRALKMEAIAHPPFISTCGDNPPAFLDPAFAMQRDED